MATRPNRSESKSGASHLATRPDYTNQSAGVKTRAVIDHATLLEGFDGSRSLLKKVVRLFLADYPQRVDEIKQSIRRGDAIALARAAHALKGSVGNFAAKKAFAIAQRLENTGRNGQLDIAGAECVALESELALVSRELRRLAATPSKSTTGPSKRARRQARRLP
jgi:HPt (histidine-containing phosphotransfer) domain-containing protein